MTVGGRVLRAPWRVSTWMATFQIVVGGIVGILTFTLLSVVGSVVLMFAVAGIRRLPLSVLLRCGRMCTRMNRSRFAALRGEPIPAVIQSPPGGPSLRSRVWAEAQQPVVRSRLAYGLLSGVALMPGTAVSMTLWTIGLLGTPIAAYAWALPERNDFGWRLHEPVTLIVLTSVGLLCLYGTPWVVRAMAAWDAAVARRLLAPSRADHLAQRVEVLAESQVRLIDAADAERRRIERDLHDGTQQRLTSLAMNLGIARELLSHLPPEEHKLVVDAHDEAMQTLTELRGFVRGLYPAVLDERGLDAALSGIAARLPVSVCLTVDVVPRPAPTIEAAAYFVVSEALTNVAKHAEADEVHIDVNRLDDRLRIRVVDDGRGGASLEKGTGLRGLRERVISAGGELAIDSPVGGPTVITVELPCVS
ncbi:histidine kinase [Sphaerisporangium krabiense]|uniref:histidine kinase n=1 Tax=Sphaerisporangium krabiense TaxID=763782 RepID=A0A7W9DPJ0_9ACTN|nr:sensor histidine kinase [Sphaerisporangium krabiense]MBB5625390.1 signal transduction histidine kinase [Sphaerisporangium krabiense]GII64095.1 histidine kinase [Sphaerisporangium krabiense]